MAIHHYDLIISGAGPAGASCAMALENSGLKVALLDKHNFPRDKICGDFITANGVRELVNIKPDLKEHFEKFPHKVIGRSTQLYVGKMNPIQIDWVLKSYTIKRELFDNELVQSILETGEIDFFPEHAVKDIEVNDQEVTATTLKGEVFKAKMIVGADGAHSPVAKILAGYKVDRDHFGGSVRAYYSGVENIDPAINEIYAHKDVLPGYFWLFPISSTEANVGVGMQSRHITAHKINLKELFYRFIDQSPVLQNKLGNAKIESKLEGFGLPFYSKKHTVSGNRFILTGDAASLVDPSNGEGIMQAITSGRMAAEHIRKAFEKDCFDADFNQAYSNSLHGKYWTEMKMKSWLVNTFADKNWVLNAVGYVCVKSPFIKRRLQKFL
ncbi:MAG: geranylgeranyl reductase family protein [Owenweeksia sp.]